MGAAVAFRSATSKNSGPSTKPKCTKSECRLRILHINDVYELDNLAVLRTAIQKLGDGVPPQNLVTTLSGDFLAPSLLSSIDDGFAMVRIMNLLPIQLVCFGNHEADVPYVSLVKRIKEFKGCWLNSNMRDFKPDLPDNFLKKLEGGRSVAFIGLNIGGGKYANTYRKGAFGGYATGITPVLEAVDDAIARCKEAYPDVDMFIPLTHQDMEDDIELAKRGICPLILGGHDHAITHEIHNGCHVVKAGADAFNVVCVDLVWPPEASPGALPVVESKVVKLAKASTDQDDFVAPYEPDAVVLQEVQRAKTKVHELEAATLAKYQPGELSSVGVRTGPSTMAVEICSALRDFGKADGGLINSGAVRGNKVYLTGEVTYGDLIKECPFPSNVIQVPILGSVLRDAISKSREAWTSGVEDGMSLQIDNGMKMDDDGLLCEVAGEALKLEKKYNIMLDSYIVHANSVLQAYANAHPDLIPPSDAGMPTMPALVNFYCYNAWCKLGEVSKGGSFSASEAQALFSKCDTSNDGLIQKEELFSVLKLHHPNVASDIVALQMLQFLDTDSDGMVSYDELCATLVDMCDTR